MINYIWWKVAITLSSREGDIWEDIGQRCEHKIWNIQDCRCYLYMTLIWRSEQHSLYNRGIQGSTTKCTRTDTQSNNFDVNANIRYNYWVWMGVDDAVLLQFKCNIIVVHFLLPMSKSQLSPDNKYYEGTERLMWRRCEWIYIIF